jgi:S1-C subfamily serine protease
MAVLEEVTSAVRDVSERVGPAVVGLGRGWGRGSGVVIGAGSVLTTAHNLRGDEVTVVFAGGRREKGAVAAVDPEADVAVVSVDTGEVEPVEWGDPGSLGAGSVVLALADPGGRGLRTTLGLVSSVGARLRGPRGRRIRGTIEHSAPLPRGSSGGPLVDEAGRLVGLNAVRMEGGLIVALPADAAMRERVEALERGEVSARPRLGVAIAPAHVARRLRSAVGLPERDGVLVRWVEEGGPADRAGIEKGDLIVMAAGEDLARADDLQRAVDAAAGSLALRVLRGTEERDVEVSFEEAAAV